MQFRKPTNADISRVRSILASHPMGSCDFTIGGIFLWIDYFNYRMCIEDDTLFLAGAVEDDLQRLSFAIPVGRMPLAQSLDMLRRYCDDNGLERLLSAVPEPCLPQLQALGAHDPVELVDWADYVYDVEALSTFAGKKLNKKRNHLNRFAADHPDAIFEPYGVANREAVLDFYRNLDLDANKPAIASYDREQTLELLSNPDDYGFEGGVLSVPGLGVVAFSMGEVVGSTLHVHVEKIDHRVTGAGERVCRDFTAAMYARYPQIQWVNREDDSGDPGLRQAKQALNPALLLRKYKILF